MIPSNPVAFWQYFDAITLASLFIIITLLLFAYRRKHGRLMMTISQTVASTKTTRIIFSISMTIFYPLYYSFIWFWVGPKTGMPSSFYYLLLASAISEMVFVWIPATKGISNKIHTLAFAFVSIVMFTVPLLILRYGTGLSAISKVGVITFTTIALIIGGMMLVKKYQKYMLIYEVVYCVTFLSLMSLIAHT